MVDFKQMGIDHIFHRREPPIPKNLTFNTRHDHCGGVERKKSSEGSQKALNIIQQCHTDIQGAQASKDLGATVPLHRHNHF